MFAFVFAFVFVFVLVLVRVSFALCTWCKCICTSFHSFEFTLSRAIYILSAYYDLLSMCVFVCIYVCVCSYACDRPWVTKSLTGCAITLAFIPKCNCWAMLWLERINIWQCQLFWTLVSHPVLPLRVILIHAVDGRYDVTQAWEIPASICVGGVSHGCFIENGLQYGAFGDGRYVRPRRYFCDCFGVPGELDCYCDIRYLKPEWGQNVRNWSV